MKTLARSRTGERLGIPPIPDYDGQGWNPLRAFRSSLIDCWYPGWAIKGTVWQDMGPWGQHLIASGSPVATAGPRVGLKGRRAALLTSSDYYSASENGRAPNGGDKVTLVVWYPTNTNSAWLFGKGNSDGDEEWIHAQLGGMYYDSGGGDAWVQGNNSTIHDANNGYVTCGKNSGGNHQVKMISSTGFDSGWFEASRTAGASSSTGPIQIGRARNGTGGYTGYVADAFCIRGTLSNTLADDLMKKFALYYGIRS